MMDIVFLRHGEPDRNICQERNFAAQGLELAPLTQKGILQARKAADSPCLKGAQLIVCSPYPRALQTAAEISRICGLEICVEMDLRELEKDLSHRQCQTEKQLDFQHQEFWRCKKHTKNTACCQKSVEQLTHHIVSVLEKYPNYNKIIVVKQ